MIGPEPTHRIEQHVKVYLAADDAGCWHVDDVSLQSGPLDGLENRAEMDDQCECDLDDPDTAEEHREALERASAHPLPDARKLLAMLAREFGYELSRRPVFRVRMTWDGNEGPPIDREMCGVPRAGDVINGPAGTLLVDEVVWNVDPALPCDVVLFMVSPGEIDTNLGGAASDPQQRTIVSLTTAQDLEHGGGRMKIEDHVTTTLHTSWAAAYACLRENFDGLGEYDDVPDDQLVRVLAESQDVHCAVTEHVIDLGDPALN